MTGKASVLGCSLDVLPHSEVLDRIALAVKGDQLLHVLTLNPEQVMAAQSNDAFRALIARAELTTIDGVGIELALRLQGIAGAERVTGVRLTDDIAKAGYPVFLLGGRPGSAELAAQNLTTANPLSRIVGAWSGGSSSDFDDRQSLRRISESCAKVVLVAFGAPAQVEWIERNREDLERIGVRVAIGVGGALDYAAGIAVPVPDWASSIGIEWLFRLLREPWRWRRQLVLPQFAVLAGAEAIRLRRNRK